MVRNVISVIDGAAGSCGKAKVVGEIATDKRIKLNAAITNCMPNAGHTFVDEKGNKTIFRNIPVSCVNPKTELFIGPGSAIDMEIFKEEYTRVECYLGDRKIYVHEMVPLIEMRHKEFERKNIKSGSTFKGCGAVTQEKVVRDLKLQFFRTFRNAVVCSNDEWLERLYKCLDDVSGYVVMEGAQGCDLDLNHSGNYPYVTSRNVSTSQLLADSGISPERLLETIMVIRPFPIRINDFTKSGEMIYSGNYGKGERFYWSQINLSSMYGSYPFEGDVECYPHFLDFDIVKKYMKNCPEIYLRQLFGVDYRRKSIKDVTLIEALELERLFYKAKGIHVYQSKFIELLKRFEDYPPNTIIDQSEQTSVTNLERKVFDLDIQKLKNNCKINTPYGLYLNFFQHLDLTYEHVCGSFDDFDYSKYVEEYLYWLQEETLCPILSCGTGAKNNEKLVKKELIKTLF